MCSCRWLICTCQCCVKVTLVLLFHLTKLKSAVIKGALHADWHLLASRPGQDSTALLEQVTGCVSLNKPAVSAQAEQAGCWSACINFRVQQRLTVSMPVTIAEPRCLLGRPAVTPATEMSTQETEHFFFFLFGWTWLHGGSFQTALACELTCLTVCERHKAGLVVLGSFCVHTGWGGRCVTLWEQLQAWQPRAVSPRLHLALFFLSVFVSPLSVLLFTPLIHQFATNWNIPISRKTQKQLKCSLKLQTSV